MQLPETSMQTSNQSLIHMLEHAVRSNPTGEALVILDGVRLTFADLAVSVIQFSEMLRSIGSAGDRVAVALPNSADAVIAILGAMNSGAQVVLLNPFYTQRELGQILRDADTLTLVCSQQLFDANQENVRAATRHAPIVSSEPFENFVRRDKAGASTAFSLPVVSELAILQYTGGTTGVSKGVDLTHRTTALNIVQRDVMLPTRFVQERFLCMTPLFHAYATATSFFPSIYSASTLIVMPRYEAGKAMDAIASERISLFGGAPTIYNGLIAHPEFARKDYSSLVGAYSGAAPLALSTLTEWERVTGVPIAEGYGLTEATAILCFNPIEGTRKAGSVGLPLPGTCVEVVDTETGNRVLKAREVGEIRAKGPQLMAGYRNRPKETAELIRDGWLYTGDIGEIDEDGYVFIRDRKKDMAIVAGYNVYPREVDEVLATHPAVVEAVSTGVPDGYRGEVIQACVKVRPNCQAVESDLIAFCTENLARYKVPAKIFVVEEISKTAAGKIDRKKTKEWLISRAAI